METEAHDLAMHEKLELHELLAFKSLCLTKAKTMQTLVSDENLKLILQKEAETAQRHIEQLQTTLSQNLERTPEPV